jgi:hypothetical protein
MNTIRKITFLKSLDSLIKRVKDGKSKLAVESVSFPGQKNEC